MHLFYKINHTRLRLASAVVSLDTFWSPHTVAGHSHQHCLKQVRER